MHIYCMRSSNTLPRIELDQWSRIHSVECYTLHAIDTRNGKFTAINAVIAVQSTKYLGWIILSFNSADLPLHNRMAYATEQ